jgi:hypothetical protein
MAGDDKKAKTSPAAKTGAPAKKKEASEAKDKIAAAAEPAKAETGDAAAATPKSYSRGEGQKPVTQAYKDNWNAIYGKKNEKKKKKR